MRYLLIFGFLFLSFVLKSQDYDTTKNKQHYINLSIGYGTNYGMFGAKTVIGIKNNGLILGAGYVNDVVDWSIGFQLSISNLFINASYGIYGINNYKQEFVFNDIEFDVYKGNEESMYGYSIIIGGMAFLDKSKQLFLELGMGYSFGYSYQDGTETKDRNKMSMIAGIGLIIL